ncbi:MAG: DUF2207 domain-containing protein [Anaerolineae bacterium]|nr:DUF2207 domain-containing protein [Anaerolineae bacterium]
MLRKLLPLCGLPAAVLLVAVLCACRPAKSYRAERFDVDIAVESGGAATITETVVFAFRNGPFTYVYREVPLRRTDGIEVLAAGEEGRAYAPGSGPGQYQVRQKGKSLRVTWRFDPTENAARTFVLAYRVRGLIRQEGVRNALRWAALPADHDYGITAAQVTVRLPEQVGPVAGAEVLAGHGQVGVLGRNVSFLAEQVERDQPLTIAIWFPHGQIGGVPPLWQQRELAQAARAPLWIAGAGLIVVAAVGGAVWAWSRYGRVRVPGKVGAVTAPPDDLPPGLASALVHAGARPADIVATLFDLSRRGVLAVEAGEPAGLLRRRPSFAFRLRTLPEALPPFEELTLWVAFAPRPEGRLSRAQRAALAQPDRAALERVAAGSGAVPMERLGESLRAKHSLLERAYDAELYGRGLFDRGRDRIRGTWMAVGLVLFGLGVGSIAVPVLWGELFGPWPLLVAGALILTGLGLVLLGSAASRRTEVGEQAARSWEAFRRHLRGMARGRPRPEEAGLLEAYLPYALAFGLGPRWARQWQAAGVSVPAWFRTLGEQAEAGRETGAFVALIAAASASSATGGAVAGGAAGGGASGAG